MQAFYHDVNVSCSILLMLGIISFVFSIKRTLMHFDVGRLRNIYPMQWNAAGVCIYLASINSGTLGPFTPVDPKSLL